jgi:quercetin dioxygenase-like cupin family protein
LAPAIAWWAMRTAPDVLENRSIGEHVQILRRADETGDRIDLRVTVEREGGGPGLHRHPNQTERFHVIRGALRVLAGEEELLLGPGDEATVPPGTAHTFRAAADDTQFDVRVAPALRMEAALEGGYALFDSGALGPDGPLDLDACRAYFEQYADEMQAVLG